MIYRQFLQKLFKNEENTINRHIKEIQKSGELDENEELLKKFKWFEMKASERLDKTYIL